MESYENENEAFEPQDEEESGVTLASLHDELMAGTSEARRGNRRTLDVLKNFGTVLDSLSAMMDETRKAVRTNAAADEALPRDWALALVELADRIARVADGFSRPPAAPRGWWPGARKHHAAWADAWSMQADALGILRSHLDSQLARGGLERLRTLVGKPFDPAVMTAVESTQDPQQPDHTVLAELLPGWRRTATGELLRPAQVRVSRKPAGI